MESDRFNAETRQSARAMVAVLEVDIGTDDLPPEAVETWRAKSLELHTTAKELLDSTTIEAARVAFYKMSFHLIERIKLFGHKYKEPVQVVYCSMAFNNRGARWLQEKESYPIRNPYFGKEMLGCGEKKELLAGKPK